MKNVSLPTFLAVTAALTIVTGRPVRLVDLFPGDGRAAVTDRLTFDLAKVRAALSGDPVEATLSDLPTDEQERVKARMVQAASTEGWPKHLADEVTFGQVFDVLDAFSEADERAARSLGVKRMLAAAAMASLWGHTFSAERDRLAGPDANPQKRGRISRELKVQLQEAINGYD